MPRSSWSPAIRSGGPVRLSNPRNRKFELDWVQEPFDYKSHFPAVGEKVIVFIPQDKKYQQLFLHRELRAELARYGLRTQSRTLIIHEVDIILKVRDIGNHIGRDSGPIRIRERDIEHQIVELRR